MSSVYALFVPSAIYREEQRFGWWVYALLALIVVLAWTFLIVRKDQGAGAQVPLDPGRWEFSIGVTLGLAIPAILVVGVLKMTTEVRPTDLRVWFGWIPTYRRAVSLSEIQRVEVVRYRPLRDCRGWGIRCAVDGTRVLSARGDQGVRLTFLDGSRLLIGSQDPENLAAAIEGATRPTV